MAVVGSGRMPEQLTLRSALTAFIDFRVECLERRTRHRLVKTEARLHVVDGLLVAQESMDEVVATIRAAPNATEARRNLEQTFALSAEQSDAILSMQLRRLTALGAVRSSTRQTRCSATSEELGALLAERGRLLALISDELAQLKKDYATPRRTAPGAASDAELTEVDPAAGRADHIT